MMEWQPIETAPANSTLILGRQGRKWLRFGQFITRVGRWYYSGTNERMQYAEVSEDDVPTHWMPLPEPPKDTAWIDAAAAHDFNDES